MTSDDVVKALKILEALESAVKPGPWKAVDASGQADFHGFPLHWEIDFGDGIIKYGWTEEMARYIVALRNTAPALMGLVRQAVAEHVPVPDRGYCESDCQDWPCPTIKALVAFSQAVNA